MSNRTLKIQLWKEDPRCHWCKRITKLTNISNIQGGVDPLMATIDHIVSRYHIHRWVKKKKTNRRRKVLACYECNHNRSVKETLSLSRAELLKRSQGFSLSPHGKPKIEKPLPSVKQVLDKVNSLDKFTPKMKEKSNWKSNAEWPKGTVGVDNDITTDDHPTQDMAQGVCDRLVRDGFGGEGKIFPIRTWITPPQ